MIKQQRIDVTKLKQNEIHPDFLSKIEDVELKVEDEGSNLIVPIHSEWIKVLPVKKITGKAFRLVHDGETAFIIEGTEENETTTIHEVEEFATEQLALSRVTALGLKIKSNELSFEEN